MVLFSLDYFTSHRESKVLILLSRPGLLGKDKFDFAKTYCDVKFDQGYQGKVFKVIVALSKVALSNKLQFK